MLGRARAPTVCGVGSGWDGGGIRERVKRERAARTSQAALVILRLILEQGACGFLSDAPVEATVRLEYQEFQPRRDPPISVCQIPRAASPLPEVSVGWSEVCNEGDVLGFVSVVTVHEHVGLIVQELLKQARIASCLKSFDLLGAVSLPIPEHPPQRAPRS
jgi:hypothetical protein